MSLSMPGVRLSSFTYSNNSLNIRVAAPDAGTNFIVLRLFARVSYSSRAASTCFSLSCFTPSPPAAALEKLDLNEILADADLNELLKGVDLNKLLTGLSLTELLTEAQIRQHLGDVDVTLLNQLQQRGQSFGGMGGGFGGPMGMQSSSDVATADFVLTRETTGFTNVRAK